VFDRIGASREPIPDKRQPKDWRQEPKKFSVPINVIRGYT
jgi:hypothetical protein